MAVLGGDRTHFHFLFGTVSSGFAAMLFGHASVSTLCKLTKFC